MSKFLAGLRRELLEAVPPFVFFFIAFHLVALTRALFLGPLSEAGPAVNNAAPGKS